MAQVKMQLQNMCNRDNESFKEYAQRWRDLTDQVVLPMIEKDDNHDNWHIVGVLL